MKVMEAKLFSNITFALSGCLQSDFKLLLCGVLNIKRGFKMEWLLGISVVLNIFLGLFVAALIYGKVSAENEAFHAREEWSKWEDRFYEAQGRLLQDHNLFVAPTMGEFGKMIIKEHKDT